MPDVTQHGFAPLTLRGLLTLPSIRHGLPKVYGDSHALDRPIRWAHVIELPDPRRLLRGSELVLTTGYGLPARNVANDFVP